jgi:predicted phage terminase large subunit-like protein
MDHRIATPAGFARYASSGTWRAGPHLLLLNRVLMAAAAGEPWARRVIIQMPPRHGKSEFVSGYFPAWYLGMFPDRKVILASYEAELAASWGQRNRDLLEVYGPSLFGAKVRADSSAKANWTIHKRRGGMFTTGIGGALTGRGAHLAIIDDPVKNAEQALSPTYRKRAKDWYRSTLRTRLESDQGGGAIIVIQTRWHEDDLAGWLQREGDEDWLVISLPAIAEAHETLYLPDDPATPAWTRAQGAPLWPFLRPLDDLLRSQAAQGGPEGHWWTALYQQRPVPLGGGILKPAQFRRYRLVADGYLLDRPSGPQLVSSGALRRFGTMDLAATADTRNDFTAVAACGITPDKDLLLLDMIRNRWEGPDLPRVAARIVQAYHLAYLGVESVAFQISTVLDMRRGNPAENPPRRPLAVKALYPRGDKVSRALTLAARMGGGQLYVPESAPWLAALEAEMAQFPMGEHDDQVDALAYAALEVLDVDANLLKVE